MRVGKFEKVSFNNFRNSAVNFGLVLEENDDEIKDIYNGIKIPHRGTSGSAGYDFSSPFNIILPHGKTVVIPTGVRVQIDSNWMLQLFPRSSYGFKYRMSLDNTVGIIDSDYYYADNEGHIMAKITNHGNETLKIAAGDRFIQGIFIQYGLAQNDIVDSGKRSGGIGSTGK